jgi:serine/threonine protein kinase
MAELFSREPLFPGDSEIDQLFKIFRALGTPHEDVWPGVAELPEYKPKFPQWPRRENALAQMLPAGIDPLALDLIQRMLVYDPAQRISARDALQHPYFAGMQSRVDIDSQRRVEARREDAARQWQSARTTSTSSGDVTALATSMASSPAASPLAASATASTAAESAVSTAQPLSAPSESSASHRESQPCNQE